MHVFSHPSQFNACRLWQARTLATSRTALTSARRSGSQLYNHTHQSHHTETRTRSASSQLHTRSMAGSTDAASASPSAVSTTRLRVRTHSTGDIDDWPAAAAHMRWLLCTALIASIKPEMAFWDKPNAQ